MFVIPFRFQKIKKILMSWYDIKIFTASFTLKYNPKVKKVKLIWIDFELNKSEVP